MNRHVCYLILSSDFLFNLCLSITSVKNKHHQLILDTQVELDLRGCHNCANVS